MSLDTYNDDNDDDDDDNDDNDDDRMFFPDFMFFLEFLGTSEVFKCPAFLEFLASS